MTLVLFYIFCVFRAKKGDKKGEGGAGGVKLAMTHLESRTPASARHAINAAVRDSGHNRSFYVVRQSEDFWIFFF